MRVEVWIAGRDICLGSDILVGQTSKERRRGLMGRDFLGRGSGFWLNPCEAIHTFGMNFPIDVVFLDRGFQVRSMRSAMSPWRIAVCARAESTLELPAGVIRELGMQVGDRLEIRRPK